MYKIRWKRVLALSCAAGLLILLLRGCAIAKKPEPMDAAKLRTEPYADQTITVFDGDAARAEERSLETYLVGVVAAEMPASFDEQALRAQAVAARTYTVYRAGRGGCNAHDADVCTSSACCQAFASDQALRTRWGDAYDENLERVAAAVRDTNGQVLCYDGKPIEALYHSASGGYTEDSENVFAAAVPYLRAVESEQEIGSSHLSGTVSLSYAAFCDRVNAACPDAKLRPDNLAEQIEIIGRTESGRVTSIRLGGASLSGKALRKLLSLDSTLFTIALMGGSIRFDTRGYGHGVGMSQTGANAMGQAGYSYEQILLHYYTGTTLQNVSELTGRADGG